MNTEEKELFLEWLKKEKPMMYQLSLDGIDEYETKVDYMFLAWQASANREGYKLVLVEPTDVKLKEFQKIWLDSGCAHIMKKKTAFDLYKAMIGEETK